MYPKQTYFSLVPAGGDLHKDELLHPGEKSLTGAGRQEMSMLGEFTMTRYHWGHSQNKLYILVYCSVVM